KQPAELAYRMPLPSEAAVSAVRVCQANRCVDARPWARGQKDGAEPVTGPELAADRIVDARGNALALRAASVAKDAPLTLELEYVAAAELRGGVARFQLPARGYDPRAAPAHIALSAPGLTKLEPAPELTLDPWLPLSVRAELGERPGRIAISTRARCG